MKKIHDDYQEKFDLRIIDNYYNIFKKKQVN